MSRQYSNILKHLGSHFEIITTKNDYEKMDENDREFVFSCKLKKHKNILKTTSYINKRSLFNKEKNHLKSFVSIVLMKKIKKIILKLINSKY
jgi:hypothetical protein